MNDAEFEALEREYERRDADSPRCNGCGKSPDQLPEYDDIARAEGYKSALEACREEEGTFNSYNGHFWCNSCYIKAGTPLGLAK